MKGNVKCNRCNVKLIKDVNWTKAKYSKNRKYCTNCIKFYNKRYKAKNPNWSKKLYEKKKSNDPNFIRKNNLKYRFGLTIEKFNEMSSKQNNVCLLCDKPQSKGHSNYLCVDHCHKSGKVRGLLCTRCNSGLGHFKDNPEFIKNAIKYLKESKNA